MFVRFSVDTLYSSTGFLAKIHYGNEIINQRLVQRDNKTTVSIYFCKCSLVKKDSAVSPKIQFGCIFCGICLLWKQILLLLDFACKYDQSWIFNYDFWNVG